MPPTDQAIFDQAVAELPERLRPQAKEYWQQFESSLEATPEPRESWLSTLPRVWAISEFVARTCQTHPHVLGGLIQSGDLFRAYSGGEVSKRVAEFLAGVADEMELKQRLRALRRREMVRIVWRDLAGWTELNEVLMTLSDLADACTGGALDYLYAWAKDKHGEPTGAHSGKQVLLVVLGLGKLGGRELNFSSDIDLIFTYAEEGEAQGPRPLSNHEFFTRLGQSLISTLADSTEDGFVFRVDMRLRPNGKSGPIALSFDAMEHYYQIHGRDWERYALIKARVIAGDRAAGDQLLARLKPFVYRKYLDYGAVESIRDMKTLINRELLRKGIQNNIKIGPGGIREIEFSGQAFQLIRGGREPRLQQRSIVPVLTFLGSIGFITDVAAKDLIVAYRFLRTTENRLQMMADQQTHILPTAAAEQDKLALAMGYPDWSGFVTVLDRNRRKVHEHFSQVFVAPQREPEAPEQPGLAGVWLGTVDPDTATKLLRAAGFDRPQDVLGLLRGLREGSAYSALSSEGRARMERLMPLLLGAAGLAHDAHTTLARLIHLLEAIGRRSAYLALLVENPMVLSQLVKLCSASPWIANWISQHPLLLDELLDPRELYALPVRAELERELDEVLLQVPEDDTETQMERLREYLNSHVLRVAAADMAQGGGSFGDVGRATPSEEASPRETSAIGPGLTPEVVSLQLSQIAEVVLVRSLDLAAHALVKRHGRPCCPQGEPVADPGFALIGYGKLGSHELGYTSDLDLIFLHEACLENGMTTGPRSLPNEAYFARLGQRLIHYLTTRMSGGILYEVDMRLRPSGNAGPLVVSLVAFEAYQHEHAWTWEHQALVRARPVAGKPELCREFSAVRHKILCLERDPERLRRDVREMRNKMLAEHASKEAGLFDVKHDRGGIVDIEFMVQYGVLRWAHDHPDLTRHTDNINILKALAQAGRLEKERARLLVDAYHRYLSIEHRLKLMERGALIPRAELNDLPDKVAAAWDEMIGQEQA